MKKLFPKLGAIAVADYVIDGKVQKEVTLGKVTKVTKLHFFTESESGEKIKRFYSYGVTNGLRLKEFKNEEA